jgi:hypothetical protein
MRVPRRSTMNVMRSEALTTIGVSAWAEINKRLKG